MRLLAFLLLVVPALADPGALRVERAGAELRLRSGAPVQVRTRMVGANVRVDVWPAGTVVGKLPAGVVVTWPDSGTVRLEWPAPRGSGARCVRATDGRAFRVVQVPVVAGKRPKTVSLDFINAELPYIIKVLARETGRNVYLGPGVDGLLSVSLHSAPPEAALALILDESGLDYKVVSNGTGGQTVVVAPPEKLATTPDDVFAQKTSVSEPPPPPQTDYVPVKHGDINEIKQLLATLVPDVAYGIDAEARGLILTGAPGALDQVKELLAEFDQPTDQIVIDVKLVELSVTQAKELGLDEARPSVQILPRPPFYPYPERRTGIVLAAPRVASLQGRPVEIHIGDQVAIPSFDPLSGQFAVPNVELGLRVNVLPTFKDGYITLQLNVESRFVTELVSHQYPSVAQRKDVRQLKIKGRDTVVLANLLPAEAIRAAQANPVLCESSITGTILRSAKPDSQIVLLLTPHLMK